MQQEKLTKKLIGMKVVKRQNVALPSSVTSNVVNCDRASFRKNAERVLAGLVTDWVLKRREGRRVEEIKNIRSFFCDPKGEMDNDFLRLKIISNRENSREMLLKSPQKKRIITSKL